MKKNTTIIRFGPFDFYLKVNELFNLRKVIFFLLITIHSFAQVTTESKGVKVSGVINDEKGISIPGASVTISETKKGVVSDFDGKYSIIVEPGQKLLFSFIGFTTKRVVFKNQKEINIEIV